MSASAPRPRRLSRGAHRYIAVEILKAFLLVLLVFEAVLGSIFSFGAVKDYGVDLALLLPLLAPALAAYLDAAVPVSLLFACALVYGRLIADREVAALKSFGFSYAELGLAPALIGAASFAAVLGLSLFAIPELRYTRDNLRSVILEQLRYLGEGEHQSFPLGRTATLWIEGFKGKSLRGIFIATEAGSSLGIKGLEEPGGRGVVAARSYPFFIYAAEGAVVEDPARRAVAIELRDVAVYYDTEYRPRRVSAELADFKQRAHARSARLPLILPEVERKNNKEVIWPELRRRVAEARRRLRSLRAAEAAPEEIQRAARDYNVGVAEGHRRLALSLATLLFPVAACGLALLLNSPNRLLPVFVSLLLVPPVFYSLEMWGSARARAGAVPWLTAEAGNLGVAALVLAVFFVLRRRTVW